MQDLVEQLAALLIEKDMTVAVAESCTGGLLAAALTHKPGSSKFFKCGFVTYANDCKISVLGVPADMIAQDGAVSDRAAERMALGALDRAKSSLAIAITGIAGPDGGTAEKPVGLVYFGYALKNGSSGSVHEVFKGDRNAIQAQAVSTALRQLIAVLGAHG